MVNAMIAGVASYVPEDILTNEELSKMVDTTDEWITTRVGIKTRHILKGEGLGSSKMGSRAVKKVLRKTNTDAGEVEAVICATSTPDYRFPSTASIIARKAGITNAFCYDIQAACSGFIVALQAATAYIRSGMCKKVMVVAAEKMSSNHRLPRPLNLSALWRWRSCCIGCRHRRRLWRDGLDYPHRWCRTSLPAHESRRLSTSSQPRNGRPPRALRLPGRPHRL